MSADLMRLHALRGAFGASAAREKRTLLARCRRARWRRSVDVAAYHDELLFLAAFPDDATLHRAAIRALDGFERIVGRLSRPQREALADTGIAGTETTHTYMYGIARWAARAGQRVEFEWPRERDAERLDPLLRLTLTAAETDRFDSGDVSSTAWFSMASRDHPGGAVSWLLADAPANDRAAGKARARTDRMAAEAWRAIYDAAEPPVRWSLTETARSVSRNRVPRPRPTVRTGFRSTPADPLALVRAPLRGIERLRGADAARWHDASLSAIAARAREVFPTIYANLDEIYLCPLGEGAQLCVLGVTPEDRSVLEANYGYVMFSNGVPIGYGGVTPFGAQANTGANLFESFRKSEAAFLFGQSLRAFRTLFGSRRFVVNPYQFGRDNEEALSSGAYWFYDRLGFRPESPAIRALAARERHRIAEDRLHRSSRRTLMRLAGGDLVLDLGGTSSAIPRVPESILTELGARVSAALASVGAGAREAYLEEAAVRLLRTCTGERRRLRTTERLGARLLAPALLTIESAIGRWDRTDREALWRLVRLKGARQERGFARAAAELPALWTALTNRNASITQRSSRRHRR